MAIALSVHVKDVLGTAIPYANVKFNCVHILPNGIAEGYTMSGVTDTMGNCYIDGLAELGLPYDVNLYVNAPNYIPWDTYDRHTIHTDVIYKEVTLLPSDWLMYWWLYLIIAIIVIVIYLMAK